MKELVETIAKALADHPEEVRVKSGEGAQVIVLGYKCTRRPGQSDLGGRGGRRRRFERCLARGGDKASKRLYAGNPED